MDAWSATWCLTHSICRLSLSLLISLFFSLPPPLSHFSLFLSRSSFSLFFSPAPFPSFSPSLLLYLFFFLHPPFSLFLSRSSFLYFLSPAPFPSFSLSLLLSLFFSLPPFSLLSPFLPPSSFLSFSPSLLLFLFFSTSLSLSLSVYLCLSLSKLTFARTTESVRQRSHDHILLARHLEISVIDRTSHRHPLESAYINHHP